MEGHLFETMRSEVFFGKVILGQAIVEELSTSHPDVSLPSQVVSLIAVHVVV